MKPQRVLQPAQGRAPELALARQRAEESQTAFVRTCPITRRLGSDSSARGRAAAAGGQRARPPQAADRDPAALPVMPCG